MKGLIAGLLSAVSLMFSSCLGCQGCIMALEGCEADHTDGICDMCEIYDGEQISDSLEICTQCMGNYGDLDGCGCY